MPIYNSILVIISVLNKETDPININKPDGNIIFFAFGLFFLAMCSAIYYYRRTKIKENQYSFEKSISVKLKRTNHKGEHKIIIKNTSTEFIEISAPEIILKGFNLGKRMKVRSNNYPLTISPGSNHTIVFNKRQLLKEEHGKFEPKLFRLKISDKNKNSIKTKFKFL